MGPLKRGIRNTFRNLLRTFSVMLILGISLGLVLVMLSARSAVDQRITEVKERIGNTVTINSAGARGFLGGGEPLTQEQIDAVATISHVSSVDATIDAQLIPDTDTTLQSPIEAGTLGNRQGRAFRVEGGAAGQSANDSTNEPPVNFTPPIFAIGTSNPRYAGELVGANVTLSEGEYFDGSSSDYVAILGKNVAEKNSLSVGSTFTAFATTITVSGIYDAGNEFSNNSVLFPMHTLQLLSGQDGQINSAVAHIDSADNIASASDAISQQLGSAADITSSEETVTQAIEPLENIQTIATTSLIGALLAATVITLLTMIMIVRERRKEIAVLKAIGGSDASIVSQFVSEAVMLSLLGGVIGTVLGFIFSNPILDSLLRSSSSEPSFTSSGPGGGFARVAVGGFRALGNTIQDLQAVLDFRLIAYGFLAAILIAIIGSAFPAWLIGKVRPAEVLRGE
ncbi:MAG: ABC transporter permease [Candidatus Nomurabacteria bacterium]|nr:MAG: ABC transporter permease [Candidatus Nomurabacteria bacterium]